MRKVSKVSVHYQRGDFEHNCGNCDMFDGKGACELVAGYIDRRDVCRKWTRRGETMTMPEFEEEFHAGTGDNPMAARNSEQESNQPGPRR